MNHFSFDKQPGRTAIVNGKEHLFFSGYAYLGIQHVPEFNALVKEGIDKYGWLFPSSRISNTRLALFEECEALLSSITKCEDTVLVSSGYTAGRMATQKWANSLTNLHPSHPAILRDTCHPSQGYYAVASLDPLTATLADIQMLQDDACKALIIDDSHGIGLTGNGAGASGYLQKQPGIDYIFTYSMAKAWGINAGAVSCPQTLANYYRSLPEYTASTPPSPALLHAFIKGQHLYALQSQKLQQNMQYFQSLISNIKDISYHEALPIFILPDGINEDTLLKKNIIISSFAYPDPNGKKIQRVVLTALHTKNDMEYLAENLAPALKGEERKYQ